MSRIADAFQRAAARVRAGLLLETGKRRDGRKKAPDRVVAWRQHMYGNATFCDIFTLCRPDRSLQIYLGIVRGVREWSGVSLSLR